MTGLVSIYDHAELALAAYSDLEVGTTSNQRTKLENDGDGLSFTQAKEFAERWTDVIARRDFLGFSATVFRSGNEVCIAIAGTDP